MPSKKMTRGVTQNVYSTLTSVGLLFYFSSFVGVTFAATTSTTVKTQASSVSTYSGVATLVPGDNLFALNSTFNEYMQYGAICVLLGCVKGPQQHSVEVCLSLCEGLSYRTTGIIAQG
jgi:hypothetical protein